MKIALTIIACIAVLVVGTVGFIYSGLYDVSALHPDNAIVAWALHTTSDHSVASRLGGIAEPPDLDNSETIQSGAKFFGNHCVICHGGPGLLPTDVAQGLNPSPPNLFSPKRENDTVEMFYFITNGIKMTGMPAFGKTLSDSQVWTLATFLHKTPGISGKDFAALTGVGGNPGSDPAKSVP
jgi:mono/diheme cytochrome c family protein